MMLLLPNFATSCPKTECSFPRVEIIASVTVFVGGKT